MGFWARGGGEVGEHRTQTLSPGWLATWAGRADPGHPVLFLSAGVMACPGGCLTAEQVRLGVGLAPVTPGPSG